METGSRLVEVSGNTQGVRPDPRVCTRMEWQCTLGAQGVAAEEFCKYPPKIGPKTDGNREKLGVLAVNWVYPFLTPLQLGGPEETGNRLGGEPVWSAGDGNPSGAKPLKMSQPGGHKRLKQNRRVCTAKTWDA